MPAQRDPRVTDLRRYRRERERARRAARKPASNEPFFGSRPRAGLILVAVVALLVVLWLLRGRH